MKNKKQFIIIASLFILTISHSLAQPNNNSVEPNKIYPQQIFNYQTPQVQANPAYSDSPLPPQVNLSLVFGNQVYSNPNDELLKTLYGDDYENSVYHRTKEALKEDTKLRQQINKLQQTRNNNIQLNVHYDNPNKLFPGETLTYFDCATREFKSERVNEGDTLDTIAGRMGITTTQLVESNSRRFNLWPHATWSDSTVNIGESSNHYSDDELKALIAHEAAHTVDGTALYPHNYGNDGHHYVSEVTDRRTAWIEGWAIYNGGLFNQSDTKRMSSATCGLRRETEESAPNDPIYDELQRAHFMTTLRNEGTVAAILTNIDGNGVHRDKILDTFKSGNQNWEKESLANRDIVSFTLDYMEANPEQTIRTMLAIDCATRFKASDERLTKLFGPFALEYLKERDKYRSDYYEENQLDKYFCNNTIDFFTKWDGKQSEQTIGESDDTEVQLDPMSLLNQNS